MYDYKEDFSIIDQDFDIWRIFEFWEIIWILGIVFGYVELEGIVINRVIIFFEF